jgi:hypothetical protein
MEHLHASPKKADCCGLVTRCLAERWRVVDVA